MFAPAVTDVDSGTVFLPHDGSSRDQRVSQRPGIWESFGNTRTISIFPESASWMSAPAVASCRFRPRRRALGGRVFRHGRSSRQDFPPANKLAFRDQDAFSASITSGLYNGETVASHRPLAARVESILWHYLFQSRWRLVGLTSPSLARPERLSDQCYRIRFPCYIGKDDFSPACWIRMRKLPNFLGDSPNLKMISCSGATRERYIIMFCRC